MMRWHHIVLAAVSVLAATVLAALPWGLPAELRLVPPLIPFLVIHFWVMRSVDLVSELLVFAAGLALDIVTGGPAGYWALIYLVGYALTLAMSELPLTAGPLMRWLALGVTLAALSLVEVLLAAVYFNAAADWSPPLFAALVATVLYPIVAALLWLVAGPDGAASERDASWSQAS